MDILSKDFPQMVIKNDPPLAAPNLDKCNKMTHPPNPPPFAKRGLEGVKDSQPDAAVTNSPHPSSYAAGQPPSMEHVERSGSVSESRANGGEGLTSLSSSGEGDKVAKSPELADGSGYVNQSILCLALWESCLVKFDCL